MNPEPKLIGYRQGIRQMWPVYDRPIYYPPTVIGGQCPPYAPVTPYKGGYTCVEKPNAFGAVSPSSESNTQAELATTMVLRGAVGTVIGAAVSPKGSEGIWGAIGFGMGAILGEMGIVGIALAALWKKV